MIKRIELEDSELAFLIETLELEVTRLSMIKTIDPVSQLIKCNRLDNIIHCLENPINIDWD